MTLLRKISSVMDMPKEFAVEKFTAMVQGLRPKWTHAVARFYIAAPLVADAFCEKVQKMCDVAALRVMGHDLSDIDEWSLQHIRLRAADGGWGLVDLKTEVKLRALRSFADAGAAFPLLGPLAVNMWAQIQSEHVEQPLGRLRSRVQCLLDQLRDDTVLGLDVLLPPDLVSLFQWGGRKGPWRTLQRRISNFAMSALIAKAEVAGREDVIARVVSGAHSLAAMQLLDPEVITRVPAAPFVAFHNVAKGLPPPGFGEAGELTCACGKPLTDTHMLVCTRGGLPHQGQMAPSPSSPY